MKEPIHYIYYLICPITNKIRYVGVSLNPESRLKGHMSDFIANPKKCNWIKYLMKRGMKPILKIAQDIESRDFVREAEESHIKLHRETIFNSTRKVSYPSKYYDKYNSTKYHDSGLLED